MSPNPTPGLASKEDDKLEWRDSPEVAALSDALKRRRRVGVRLSRRLDGGFRVFIDPPAGADEPERLAAMAEIVGLTIEALEDLKTLAAAESIPLPFHARHGCGAWVQMRAETLEAARRTAFLWCGKCRAKWTPAGAGMDPRRDDDD